MTDASYRDLLNACIAGRGLSRGEARGAFSAIMDGAWSEAQIAGLLVAMAAKGESIEEISGAADAMRAHAVRIDTGGAEVVDVVGTGGTGLSTFNISTTSALVAAGAGAKVAKHGNRTNVRASGAADVLAALGVNLDAPPETVARCLAEAGVCFCFAPKFHPAMRYAVPVRKQLGVRTIFNVLGPLTNPAGATRQVMGVYDAALTEPMAEVLKNLGVKRAMVVCGEDGLDELTVTGSTTAAELCDGEITTRRVKPEDFGLSRWKLDELLVDSPEASAAAVRGVLAGESGARREIVLLNAGATLAVAGVAADTRAGIDAAAKAIDGGAAAAALEKLVSVSNA